MSMQEKRAMQRRQKELEEYEAQMLKRYAMQKEEREQELKQKKAELEAAKEEIF